MPFKAEFDDVYKLGIRAAAKEVGAYTERVDEQVFAGGILERIYNQISKADVIVAEMTGQRPNVFYEVGYAHALGKIVVLLTQRADDIPFDLQQHQHIVYGGKVHVLLDALKPKLAWAIGEAKKGNKSSRRIDIGVSAFGTEIPEQPPNATLPTVSKTKKFLGAFMLPITVRNRSGQTMPDISHIYLLVGTNRGLNFGALQERSQTTHFGGESMEQTLNYINPFDPVDPDGIDRGLGFERMYRVPQGLIGVPSSAADVLRLGVDGVDRQLPLPLVQKLCLRICAPDGNRDFPFNLVIGAPAPDSSA